MKELGLLMLILVLCFFLTNTLSSNKNDSFAIRSKHDFVVTNNQVTGADTIIITLP